MLNIILIVLRTNSTIHSFLYSISKIIRLELANILHVHFLLFPPLHHAMPGTLFLSPITASEFRYFIIVMKLFHI